MTVILTIPSDPTVAPDPITPLDGTQNIIGNFAVTGGVTSNGLNVSILGTGPSTSILYDPGEAATATGLLLAPISAATDPDQQYSPGLTFRAHGWTGGPGGAQTNTEYSLNVTGPLNGTGNLELWHEFDGGGRTRRMQFDPVGAVLLNSGGALNQSGVFDQQRQGGINFDALGRVRIYGHDDVGGNGQIIAIWGLGRGLEFQIGGTAALPVLRIADLTTGFFRPPIIDTLALSNAGIETVRWDASNNQINTGNIQLGLNQRLILDADADTYFTTTTDDLIELTTNSVKRQTWTDNSTTPVSIITRNAVGEVTNDTMTGLLLENTTDAAAGAQQFSPMLQWRGQGWKLAATAASQSVQFAAQLEPTEGGVTPGGHLQFKTNINGIGYVDGVAFGTNGQVLAIDGNSGTPGYAFASNQNTGLKLLSSEIITVINGVIVLGTTANGLSTKVLGSATNPAIRLTTQATGLFWESNVVAVTTAALEAVRWTNTQLQINKGAIQGPDGTGSVKTFGFTSEPSTGMYLVSSLTLGLGAGGSNTFEVSNSRVRLALAGVEVAPSMVIVDAGTGFWSPGTHIVALSTGGTENVRWVGNNQLNAGNVQLLDNSKLVLDTDLDTYITATADDFIRIAVGGAEQLYMTPSAFRLLDGPAAFFDKDAIATNSTTSQKLYLRNNTAATAGIPVQNSPMLQLQGFGWKTDATAASQSVGFTMQTQPLQGTANPSGDLVFKSQVNGVFNTVLSVDSAGTLKSIIGGTESARVDDNATAGETRFMLYDVDNATLERVTVGAADSGGAGFKVLRIPN